MRLHATLHQFTCNTNIILQQAISVFTERDTLIDDEFLHITNNINNINMFS